MAIVDLIMPKMGESIMEATILNWHKKPGDHVDVDETVLEIATDKVDSEVPSIVEGTLTEILFKEDAVVPVGAPIARIETSGEVVADDEIALLDEEEEEAAGPVDQDDSADQPPDSAAPEPIGAVEAEPVEESRFYSPLVLKIATEEGIRLSELEQLSGSGLGGRVTKKDILRYVADRKAGKGAAASQPLQAPRETTPAMGQAVTPFSGATRRGNVEIIHMDRMRKMIAQHMVQSKQISPHVTSFSEADVTHMVKWRERVKKTFAEREGEKLTFTPLFIEAIVKCIKKFPLVNSSVEGDDILVKKDINIGMATALANGSLIVPVIKGADQLNLVGLAHQVNNLAQQARSGRLSPDATRDGTFTLTNVGTFGSLAGTPIINQPQVAILAVGAIKKRAVVVETAQGDSIAIRHMMYLSMSYDHRIVDGSLGATFLAAVAAELEQFNMDREI